MQIKKQKEQIVAEIGRGFRNWSKQGVYKKQPRRYYYSSENNSNPKDSTKLGTNNQESQIKKPII